MNTFRMHVPIPEYENFGDSDGDVMYDDDAGCTTDFSQLSDELNSGSLESLFPPVRSNGLRQQRLRNELL